MNNLNTVLYDVLFIPHEHCEGNFKLAYNAR